MTESANDPGRRASRADNRRRTARRAFLARRSAGPRNVSRSRAREPRARIPDLVGRGCRDPTISGRGFNLIKALRRHFRATPFCLEPSRSHRNPSIQKIVERLASWDSFPIWEFSKLCRAENFQSRRNAVPSSVRPPARHRLAARGRARAVVQGWSPRSERCRRGSCVGSVTHEGRPSATKKCTVTVTLSP
jgi:hypothetical protein